MPGLHHGCFVHGANPCCGRCNYVADVYRSTMNKFLKKKAPEALVLNDEPVYSRPSAPSSPTSPGPKKGNSSRWRKNKKQPEAKPSIDLASVLPTNDDFRTSLLMPKLSARFSMLREQDDPNSIIGKASDDSVLQPRRRSRMLDFGFNASGLSDIDEVSSLSGSIQPPFAAPFARQQSYASDDGYGSDADIHAGSSVLGRSRPGEGNNLFGGRQKIYKINAAGSTRSLGKAVYEDDVGLSAFQRYRRERVVEHRPSDDSMGFDFGLDNNDIGPGKTSSDSMGKERSESPSLSTYDKKRSTASSSVQSEGRSSIAATSITSPSINSAAPSPSLAAAQSVASSSSIERATPKSRRLYEQGLDQHMQDQQTSALTRLNSIQRQRAGAKQLHSVKSTGNLHDRPPQPVYALRTQSPTNPPPSSAHSLGSLKKLHSNGHSPNPSTPGSPTDSAPNEKDVLSRAMDPSDRGKATALGAFNKPQQAFDEQQYMERQLQLHRSNSNAVGAQQVQNRIGRFEQEIQRSSSDTNRARSGSSTTRKPEPSRVATNPSKSQVAATKAALLETHRTFFGDIKASESEDEEESQNAQAFSPPDYGYGLYHGKWQPTPLPSVSEHPALRAQKSKSNVAEASEKLEPPPLRTNKPPTNPLLNTVVKSASFAEGVDSPTLGLGHQHLNGMVHHLRQRSNQSSIYPMDDTVADDDVNPASWDSNKPPPCDTLDEISRHDSTYTTSNPWDLEDHERGPAAQHDHNASRDEESEAFVDALPWQHELHRQHTREASNATQLERDAFANELATRRNAIQQSIKKQVEQREAQSRGPSPARGVSGPFKALGMMRTKSSREALTLSREASKSQKNLGMAIGNQSSTSIASLSDRSGMGMDISRSHTDSPPVPPIPSNAQHPAYQQSNSRDWETGRQHPATRSAVSSKERHERSRSNSTTTNGRSRSRTGPYRDDLERAMIEGTGSSTSTSMSNDMAYGLPREPTPRASPDIILNHNDSSKPGMGNYFEAKQPLTVQTSANSRLYVQGPSPAGHSPNHASPMSAARATPPVSSTSTPAVSPGISFPSRPSMSRRKTISKSDISTPKLISTTSSFDTVDLPEGASLMNGTDEPPPIPPINPRRRGGRKFFGIGRQDSGEERPTTSSDNHSHASSRDLQNNGHPMPVYNGFARSSPPEHEGYMI